MTTGAQHLLQGLADAGIDTIFTNPGTTEIYFVAALGRAPTLRPILTLNEAVAAGAADGYARMSGSPSALLLHLGPGLANAAAYLHNAKRAQSPLVVIVGDHPQAIAMQDPPLASDIGSLAATFSKAVLAASPEYHPRHIAALAAHLAMQGPSGIVTLLVPSDLSWQEFEDVPSRTADELMSSAGKSATGANLQNLEEAKQAIKNPNGTTIVVGGDLLTKRGATQLAQLLAHPNLTIVANTFPARLDRGAGAPHVRRLPYLPELAIEALRHTHKLVVIGGTPPVPFFGYPNLPNRLIPDNCDVIVVTTDHKAAIAGAEMLLATDTVRQSLKAPEASSTTQPPDRLDPSTFADTVASLLPQDAIVVDESNTGGLNLEEATKNAARHTWLPALTGGAIGHGLSLAVGASVAAPGHRVIALVADGSSLYAPQALWTYASQRLPITSVILVNRSYAILGFELMRLGPEFQTEGARRLLALESPTIDHVSLARSFGVPAFQAETANQLRDAIAQSLTVDGPTLVAAVIP